LVASRTRNVGNLVGSDYVFPVTANALIREEAASPRLQPWSERKYLILGSSDVEEIVKDIVATKPDLIVNTSMAIRRTWPFFGRCAGRGLPPRQFPLCR